MYSSDGQSVQVSLSSKCGKAQVMYAKPSSTTNMETHWEEVIQCAQPEKRLFKRAEFNVDGEDTESELIAIPESDVSDSTLHGSAPVSHYVLVSSFFHTFYWYYFRIYSMTFLRRLLVHNRKIK